jgi:hypothetical protein
VKNAHNNMNGNDKRIASCKAVGGQKKRSGHTLEHLHDSLFGETQTTTSTKAEADCKITNADHLEQIRATFPDLKIDGHVSVKSGNNLQFTLGNIPEITDVDDKLAAMKTPALWQKYLAKSESGKPCDLLTYFDRNNNTWTYFAMADVINFIATKSTWRMLSSGRIKGDFQDSSKKGYSQYLTYEYRQTHRSYFLGANGNKGKPLIRLLTTNLRHFTKQSSL